MPITLPKPPLGAQVNCSHPLGRSLVHGFLFNEKSGKKFNDIATGWVTDAFGANTGVDAQGPYCVADGDGAYVGGTYPRKGFFGSSEWSSNTRTVSVATQFKYRTPTYEGYGNAYVSVYGDGWADLEVGVSSTGQITAYFGWMYSGGTVTSEYTATDGELLTVVVTLSKTGLTKIYVNGVSHAQVTQSMQGGSTESVWKIYPFGSDAYLRSPSKAGAQGYWTYFFDRELTEAEVAAITADPYQILDTDPISRLYVQSAATTYTATHTTSSRLIPAAKDYTREAKASLPTTDTPLATDYTATDYSNVASANGVRVDLEADQYAIHQYRAQGSSQAPFTATWTGQCARATTAATVYLQVFNRTSQTWVDIDSDNSTAANTDITLTATVSTNLADYYDSNYWLSFRVYQYGQ